MKFQITEIEFDFAADDIGYGDTMDDFLTDEYKQSVTADHIGMIVEADDGDDLVEEITSTTGWCVKSIDYNHVLK